MTFRHRLRKHVTTWFDPNFWNAPALARHQAGDGVLLPQVVHAGQ